MKAIQHPFYVEEKQNLDDTLQVIRDNLTLCLDGMKGEFWSYRADIEAQQQKYHNRAEKLKLLIKKPYFGRVDWLSDNVCDTFYIGNVLFDQKNIFAWQDTLAGDLYYGLKTTRENGELLLKRTFEIGNDQLITIADEFVDPKHPNAGVIQSNLYVDEVLLRLLNESRKTQLRDIVATIQARQYQLIQSPLDRVLLIQGAPGSGKTVIALHRLSYLLYHNNKEFSAPSLLILGPSHLFLHHTANVLPILGERKIPQKTFDQWIVEQLGISIEYDTPENALEMFLDASTPLIKKIIALRNGRNKGSVRMATLLEKYVDLLASQMLADKDDLVCRYIPRESSRSERINPIRVVKSADKIFDLLDSLKSTAFNKRKNQLIENLVTEITRDIQIDLPSSTAFTKTDTMDDIATEIRKQISAYLDDWHELNVSITYRQLFRKPELLHQAGKDIFTPWELELLLLDVPKKINHVHASDLPALLYFNILLNGNITNEEKYHHVVVDEAQDMSALHYKVLSHYCRENSMTILGDLGQGIYINQGIARWEELEDAGFQYHKEVIQRSYRSTAQISRYTRKIMEKMTADELLESVPFARDGDEPQEVAYSSREDLVHALPAIIRQKQEIGWITIAIICKNKAGCTSLVNELHSIGYVDFQFLDSSEKEYAGGVAVLPSYLAKGLEFDVVIVVDADAKTYATNELDAHLLYVALTRAAQSLHVVWVGEKTAWLNQDIEQLSAEPFLGEYIQPSPITIENYANKHNQEADWYVERLASEDKLPLMENGTMDQVFLDALFSLRQSSHDETSDEASLIEIPIDLRNSILEKVTEAQASGNVNGLVFSQVTFGLLRGHLRNLGAIQTEEESLSLVSQVELLTRLYYTINKSRISFSAGRWTTKRKVLEKLQKEYKETGREILQLLLDYGVVEEKPGDQASSAPNRGAEIRIIPAFISGILDMTFGYEPADWDEELTTRLPYSSITLNFREGEDNE